MDSVDLQDLNRGAGLAQRKPLRMLPAALASFHGRDAELADIRAALLEHRLVTLAGTGGVGKTRLAVESARNVEGFDTVAFVPLGDCTAAELIAERIRTVLQIAASPEDVTAQLITFLDGRDVLLVLDNFEHLVDAGALALVELLEALPRLRCLVTSRRVLDVPGEAVVAVDSLPLPDATMRLAAVLATPSAALFVQRARSAAPTYTATDDDRSALIELCRALDGLPLALELAASRIRSFTPAEMCAALARRFELLTRAGSRGARQGRHASLQATIEWSWQLLDPVQQRFFAGLAVFRGGCTAPAVKAIFGIRDAREQLDALVADSLLRVDVGAPGGARFEMLDTLRAFAEERIGADAGALEERHRAHFRGLARTAGSDIAAIEREFANFVRAMASAVAAEDAACALDIAVALRPYWDSHGTLPDELRLIEEAARRCPATEPVQLRALDLLADMCLNAGRAADAVVYAQAALDAAGSAPALRARALVSRARIEWEQRQNADDVLPQLDEALVLAASAGDVAAEADALRVKGTVLQERGADNADHPAALTLLERAEALYLSLGHTRWAHRVRLRRAGCLAALKRTDDARALLASCEQAFGGSDATADLLAVVNMEGYLETSLQRWPEAVAAGRRSVQIAWERQANMSLAISLWNLTTTLVLLPDYVAAARLMPFATGFWERSVGTLTAADREVVTDTRQRCEAGLGAERTAALWAEGQGMTLATAVAIALDRRAAPRVAGAIDALAPDSDETSPAGKGERRAAGTLREGYYRAVELESRLQELQREVEKLTGEATTDPLTRVPNRRGLQLAFELEVAQISAVGEGGPGLAVGLLDIDNFKKLNDTLGHAAGDVALRSLAAAVRREIRPGDHVGRFGGEEFVVLLPATSAEDGLEALTRLQRSLAGPLFEHAGAPVVVTFSAGVTAWQPGEGLDAALARADEGLYEAKRTGKNRTCIA